MVINAMILNIKGIVELGLRLWKIKHTYFLPIFPICVRKVNGQHNLKYSWL